MQCKTFNISDDRTNLHSSSDKMQCGQLKLQLKEKLTQAVAEYNKEADKILLINSKLLHFIIALHKGSLFQNYSHISKVNLNTECVEQDADKHITLHQ